MPHWIASVPVKPLSFCALPRAALLSVRLALHRSNRCAPAIEARSTTFCASRLAQYR
ncbi:hypothetical protein D3C71_1611740 [compost metagenome]